MRLARAGNLGKDVLGVTTPEDVSNFTCESCIKGKTGRLPSPPAADYTRATTPLELLHVDLWGPSRVAPRAGNRYFLTIFDDYTRRVHITLLRDKSQALNALKEYITMAETQLGKRVKQIRSDNGGEFVSNAAISGKLISSTSNGMGIVG